VPEVPLWSVPVELLPLAEPDWPLPAEPDCPPPAVPDELLPAEPDCPPPAEPPPA
jgi:hypothetical protein